MVRTDFVRGLSDSCLRKKIRKKCNPIEHTLTELIQYAIKYGKENYDVGLDSESDEDDPSGVRRHSYFAAAQMFEDRFGLGPAKKNSDRKILSSTSTSRRSGQAQGGRDEDEISMKEVAAQLVMVVAPLTEFVQNLQRQRVAAAQRQQTTIAAGTPMTRPAAAGVAQPLRCYNCNQSGHLAKDCPKPRTQSGPAGPTGPSQIPLAAHTVAGQGRVAMVMDTGTTELVPPVAVEIGPDEYMAAAMFETGTIGVIRHIQRITEESDLGSWRSGFEDLTTPGPEYKDGHIDVSDALKALDLQIPVPIPYLLTISEAANEKCGVPCDSGEKRVREFFLSKISFLGYIVTIEGLKPDPRKVEAVREAPALVTLTQVRAFLGLASYYRHFIQSFACLAKPLMNLLKKEEQLIWTPECEAAFRALKEALISAPVLARPDPTRQFALHTDRQSQAISAVLTQQGTDGREHVIEYVSKTLSQAQSNYEACKDEDARELHRALYKSVVLGMFRFFVNHEDHCIGEHFVVYYVITRPKPAQREGTVALYQFAQLQTTDPRLLELIYLELLSIAQVIASEEEEVQPRLRTTAPRRTYNAVIIPDYIAHREERLEDFPEEKSLRTPSSYPRSPKRERRPYTETHMVMTGPGPWSVRKRVVRAVADLAPRVLSHVSGGFLYPSFVQHHFHEEDAPTTPAAMTAFLPPIPPPLNPDIDHFL
ncbi:hypothetical protein CBR_g19717 [Chara braunii]|uniref:CCHC-type domain-containing protein n=1 Tax=Chara braunii TaxID=69332 RepID=A0A388KYR6_CHABU|nr:hypothetical protein CBR_g19717 [Chara braunii]|eukprot:GBG75204.1 hypothetical protein CBR_g19717 [Chara braunii]